MSFQFPWHILVALTVYRIGLTVNVFKPSDVPAGKKLPVVIVSRSSDRRRLFSVLMVSLYVIVDLWRYVFSFLIVGR